MKSTLKSMLSFFAVSTLALSLWGCPSEGPGPTPTAKCESGAACVKVSNMNLRSCALILVDSADISKPTVAFSDKVIGSSKIKSKKIAIGFILKDDKSLEAGTFAAVIKLPKGVKDLKVDKLECFDRKGAKLSKADVTFEKP